MNSIWDVATANAPSSATDFPRFIYISVVLKRWHIAFQQMSVTQQATEQIRHHAQEIRTSPDASSIDRFFH
jgi:hypothetical protein